MSFKKKTDLIMCFEKAEQISKEVRILSKKIKQCIPSSEDIDKDLTLDEISKLKILNSHLAGLQKFLLNEIAGLRPPLAEKANNPDSPLTDFEIDIEFSYVLNDTDPEYDQEDDCILTSRNVFSIDSFFSEDLDFSFEFNGNSPFGEDAICYLMHDLYDHSYGLSQERLPLNDCARVGKIWIDVVIRQQYWLDVTTGRWEKFNSEESTE